MIPGAPKKPGVVPARALLGPALSVVRTRKFVMFITRLKQAELIAMTELMEAGKVTAVIDRRFALSDAAEALRYSEARHAPGKVVIIG